MKDLGTEDSAAVMRKVTRIIEQLDTTPSFDGSTFFYTLVSEDPVLVFLKREDPTYEVRIYEWATFLPSVEKKGPALVRRQAEIMHKLIQEHRGIGVMLFFKDDFRVQVLEDQYPIPKAHGGSGKSN